MEVGGREKEGGERKNVAGFTYPQTKTWKNNCFFLRLVTQTRLECRGSEVCFDADRVAQQKRRMLGLPHELP